MVVLNRIYTRTGDAGETSLGDGARTPKHNARVEAYGAVDEANAAIGVARLYCRGRPTLDATLARIQNDLFDLGADLCTPEGKDLGYEPLRVTPTQVARLEAEIDEINADLAPLRSFVLPGGTAAAAHLHVARTVARRAERRVTAAIAAGEAISEAALRYINRLSDLLFVLARHANAAPGDGGEGGGDEGGDVLWVPGANR